MEVMTQKWLPSSDKIQDECRPGVIMKTFLQYIRNVRYWSAGIICIVENDLSWNPR